ncbi:Glycosyl hydrolases family 2, sugar binding domain [Neorhodopirellula lusitana]|uniref:Glycosyl hydrolases family 2, sugar binding domain n=1 Tax=Neorhodopirellula lusitana TaxID=445327 RepID=A0ABY1PUC5_9BACT|nr:discoidin domain-containing protein [Neorhodopirellula lusitana]SMP46310.1 Glycosyl hydrolases family 2, sugar binding domain [Neorhodopirellula lusitana]
MLTTKIRKGTPRAFVLLHALIFMCVFPASSFAIDLSGTWQVRLDPNDVGERERWFDHVDGVEISLPGTTVEAGLGTPLELEPALTKEVFQHLHPHFRYVGAAWYTRTISLEDGWQESNATLLLERLIWESTVWLNGKMVGSEDSLSTPHRYSVGDYLKTGENTLCVRVDNRPKVDIGVLGHAYTDETQTIWNGIIGRIELNRTDNQTLAIRTQPLRVQVPSSGRLVVNVEPLNSDRSDVPTWTIEVDRSGEVIVEIDHKKLTPWSEFDPALYRVTARFLSSDSSSELSANFVTGFRNVETDGRALLVNDQPAFMRGTLECCIFPKTGYPPMDITAHSPGGPNKQTSRVDNRSTTYGWGKVFRTLKEYGLNHLRFHSWCPPEAAFAAADRHGVYLQVELPNWTFKMGQSPLVDEYLLKEGERILREYSHHPSFVFFSMGNELTGDYSHLDEMIRHFRSISPHLLYTSTSYSFSKRGESPGPADDVFISQKTRTGWVRGQGFLNQTPPTTDSDYTPGLDSLDIPLITHEVGQYNVYPNLEELPKYDGNLRALNFEAIQQDLRNKGRLKDAAAYTRGSGELAAILYKEDVERALRTRGLSGIQLLDLHDFPGQSTATVGLLDAFWDSKGSITPAEFRRFCSPVVPLIRMPKRTWSSDETFTAKVEIANFSDQPIKTGNVHWKIEDQRGHVLAERTIPLDVIEIGNGNTIAEIVFPLAKVQDASQLKVTVSVEGHDSENDWNFWVYPVGPAQSNGDVVVIRRFGDKLFDALAKGQRVLFLPSREEIRAPLDGRFIPVFWSPLHFANQPGSLGTVIDAEHPLFGGFPTEQHTDWQWWELLATSTSVNVDQLGADFEPIMQFIDKYNRNSLPATLWESQVGEGSLLVCTLDIESEPAKRIAASQLKRSILSYLNSPDFSPRQTMTNEQIASLFRSRPYRLSLSNGTSHPDYPLTNLLDGDPNSIWHSDWRGGKNQYPYAVDFEMIEPMQIAGLNYVQRQDNTRGRIRRFRVRTSPNGRSWTTVAEGETPPREIRFDTPIDASHLRFEAISDVGGTENCAIAELSPIFIDRTTRVDELGLIENFNK